MPDPNIPILTPSIASPSPQAGIVPIIVDDIIEPRYPNGGELWLMRPGELTPVAKVPVDKGVIICLINPEQAVHVRAGIRKALEQIAEQQRRAANGVGPRGR